jgi:thioredoxin 1
MVAEITNIDSIRKGKVLIDFYTQNCGPCKAMHPILEELSSELTDVKVAKVEVSQNPDIGQSFGIMSVPTIIYMNDGKVKQTKRGLQNKKAIKSMIEDVDD